MASASPPVLKPIAAFEAYLAPSDVIDWQHPDIVKLAHHVTTGGQSQAAIARACFEWVRDRIQHSSDYQLNPVTCRASDVLQHSTGYCYAKSHLLAALLRANGIACGLCYQRLSVDDMGAPYCLHGLNAIYLDKFGWYRVDPRGNRPGIKAQFSPPTEVLAYQPRLAEEADCFVIFPDPLPEVVQALHTCKTWNELGVNLPDYELHQFEQLASFAVHNP